MSKMNDVIILDTAGRLHINEELMQELKNIKQNIRPHEILLVVDSMTGQDAVNVADNFNKDLGIDGIILTKLDGDTRGGAALSVKKITGRPIKFAATGEKLSDIEEFHPDRMTSRILGMGDMLSVIEKAEEAFSEEEALKLEKKLKKQEFDLDDYLTQLRQMKKMGSFSSILKMIPGMNKFGDIKVDDKEFVKIEAIICSMTKNDEKNAKQQRRNEECIKGNRHGQFEEHEILILVYNFLNLYIELKEGGKSMVKIRLQRVGKKKAPFYHIVVADSKSPRDGRIIEQIGTYDPMTEPSVVKVDSEKLQAWIKNGARPTDTVKRLIENNK